ncbi:MAG: ABC transporter ATP-binding protein [Leptolyngbya sp. SIO1D8]|nr:ABC transporter ATP-binding protein [Leptolyngbya sp. SIO1D8]
MGYLKKFIYIFTDRRQQLVILVAVFLTTSFLEAFGIGLIGPFLSIVENPSLINSNPIANKVYTQLQLQSNSQFIILSGLFIIGVFAIKSTAYLSGKFYTFKTILNQKATIRERLFSAYMLAPYEFHLGRNSADFVNKIVGEANRFTNLVALPLVELCSQTIVVIILVGLMARTNIVLVLVVLFTLLPAFLGFLVLSKRLKQWGQSSSQARKQTLKAVSHGLGGLKETRVVGCEAYFQKELHQHVRQEAAMEIRFKSAQVLPRTLIEALLIVAIVGFVCLSQFLLEQSFQSVISTMGVFAVAALRLVPASSQIVQSLGMLRNSIYTLDSLYLDLKEIETQKLIQPYPENSSAKIFSFKDSLELKDITYRYPTAKSFSLNKISMEIKRGESIGLIGSSGAGKTTLVDVILNLLTPEFGDIQVDGKSIYKNLSGWQKLVGYIPQSIFLLDDTIEQNIAFGIPKHDIDSDRLGYAIKAAQLETLIQDLPQGTHTSVGERGVRLSGGQRQRIGIARALYHQREILVLDEATSALDNETERLISDSITALAGSKTLIIIAHRLTTVEHCDRIYVLEKGQVARSGKYQDVIPTNA